MENVGLLLLGRKGLVALEAIIQAHLEERISFAVIGTDRSVQNDYSDALTEICEANDIRWMSRQEFNRQQWPCRFLIAIGWRWLVDNEQYTLITLHDSLLPAYRGFNPLVTALIAGDTAVGVTAILADEDMDTGDIVAQEGISIDYPIRIEDAIDRVAGLYGNIMLHLLQSAELSATPQNHADATYSIWRNAEDYRIDWSRNASEIIRFIDAVGFPYMGALTTYKGDDIRVLQASETHDLTIVNRTPGKLFRIRDNVPVVICGEGMLQIDQAVSDTDGQQVKFDKLRIRLT
jgi:methionyl-tRNA formyltransferase